MRFIGRREGVDPGLVEADGVGGSAPPTGNDRITLFVAFNYGGRAEIVDAARSFQGGSEEEFRRHLYAPEMHDPDLLIRTSGEQRDLQLPALAVRLLGAGLPRRALAGLHPRGAGGLAARVRVAAAPLRSEGLRMEAPREEGEERRSRPGAASARPKSCSTGSTTRSSRSGRSRRRAGRSAVRGCGARPPSGSSSRSPGSPSRSRSSSPAGSSSRSR